MHVDRKSMELPFLYFKGTQVEISNCVVFLSLKIARILTNSVHVESGEMPPYETSGSSLFAKVPVYRYPE